MTSPDFPASCSPNLPGLKPAPLDPRTEARMVAIVERDKRRAAIEAAGDRIAAAVLAAEYDLAGCPEMASRFRAAMHLPPPGREPVEAEPARKPHRKGPPRMCPSERTEALYRIVIAAGPEGILPADAARKMGTCKSAAEKHAMRLRAEGRIWTELGPSGYVWVAKGTTK